MARTEDVLQLRQRLWTLLKKYSYKEGSVVLSSGKIGSYYIDARVVTLSSEGAYLTASIILDLIKNKAQSIFGKDISAVGGPSLGADPLLGAIAALSFLSKSPLKTFIVRKTPKEYGRRKRIEGPLLKKGDKVVVVDDVATSGGSFLDCISVLRAEGVIVKGAIAVIDREEGAVENLARASCPLISIFKASDFRNRR